MVYHSPIDIVILIIEQHALLPADRCDVALAVPKALGKPAAKPSAGARSMLGRLVPLTRVDRVGIVSFICF